MWLVTIKIVNFYKKVVLFHIAFELFEYANLSSVI